MLTTIGGERYRSIEPWANQYVVVPEAAFCELIHTGVQSSLPARRNLGFVPPENELGLTPDTANADYQDLPDELQSKYENAAVELGVFLRMLRDTRDPVGDGVLKAGSRAVEEGLYRPYTPVLYLGLMALKHPDIFPWVGGRQGRDESAANNFVQLDAGIRAAELRGMAAINRVVKTRGHATELQASLLADPGYDARVN